MNELLANNYFGNSGNLPQFFDKNNINTDYFFNTNNTNTGLPLESNFFSNFPNNMNPVNIQNQNNPNSSNNNDMLNQNNLFLAANNNFLLNNNLGLNNIGNQATNLNLYEDLVKNPAADLWYQGGNQFNFGDKNFLNSNIFGENGQGLLGKHGFYLIIIIILI